MKVCVFNFAASIFSPIRLAGDGRMKDLLGLENIPAKLHPLLRQPVVPTEAVAPFEKHKKRARDFMLKHGTKHELLGWVTDPTKKSMVIEKITEIQNDFYAAKAEFLDKYPEICAAHLKKVAEECEEEGFDKCAELVDIIRLAQPTVDYLDSQVHFRFLKPKLVELDPDEEADVQEGIYWQALADVEARAKAALKATLPTTMIRAAKEIIGKFDSLTYLDGRYERVVNELTEAIKDIPVIRNEDYQTGHRLQLTGIFSMLVDTQQIDTRIKLGEGLFPGLDQILELKEDLDAGEAEAEASEGSVGSEPDMTQTEQAEADDTSMLNDADVTENDEGSDTPPLEMAGVVGEREAVYAW